MHYGLGVRLYKEALHVTYIIYYAYVTYVVLNMNNF